VSVWFTPQSADFVLKGSNRMSLRGLTDLRFSGVAGDAQW
jgi:hypothetical protein